MNKEALETTLEEERVTFYSRSKGRLWTKGETSGNHLDVIDIQKDCDDDTLLILANPHGPTCHTGKKSCFHQKTFKPKQKLAFLNDLEELIISRQKEMPDDSYTTYLFEKGVDKIAQKVGEEAVELILEAMDDRDDLLLEESADLVYHLLVLLHAKGYTFRDVAATLRKRHKI